MVYGFRPLLAALLLPFSLACGPGLEEVCGLSTKAPTRDDVADGRVQATLNGGGFDEDGSWSATANADITAGTLSMVIAKDETGSSTAELIGRGAFPICIPLGARSDRSGNATWDSRFVTNESHTGAVAILGEEGSLLVGRFQLELEDGSGTSTDTATFEDGVFRIPRR